MENIVEGEKYIISFQGFFPMKYGDLTLENLWRDMKKSYNISDFLPFAFDNGSNIFFISFKKDSWHEILQITAETQDLFYVCKSFQIFLNSLQIDVNP